LRRYRNAEAFAEAIDQAFEHAKEIPAPLRVWIAKGEKESAPRAMLIMWGTMVGVLVSVGISRGSFRCRSSRSAA